MVEQDFKKFHESVGKELLSVKDRVRNLIGAVNWGYEGRYKEAILRNVISRFLPKKYSIGTGFIINTNKEITKQVDIIIYDDSSPVLFSDGSFVIVLENTVKAIIEVKTKINSVDELQEIIEKVEFNSSKLTNPFTFPIKGGFYNGIFAYECDIDFPKLEDSLKKYFLQRKSQGLKKVNNIALGKDKFIHYFPGPMNGQLKGYELKNLSFAWFISNLLTRLDSSPLKHLNESIFYPFESKEPYLKFTIGVGHNKK